MDIQVNVHDWLQLPMLTRVEMRKVFSIPRSSHTLVEGNIVKSDGTTHEDLKAITAEKMQSYLQDDTKTDFAQLFDEVVAVISKLNEPVEPVKADPNQIMLEEWAAQLARINQQATNLGMEEQFQMLISNYVRKQYAQPTTGEGKASDKKGAQKGRTKAA